MKKTITTKIIVGVLVCHLSIGELLCLPMPQQERFGPEATLNIDTTEFGKPRDMMNIVPNRPVAAKDKNGNRLYYTPSGKLTLRINNDGSKEFSLSIKSKEVDKEGNLQKETEKQRGNTMSVIKNEKGEILGYQELGFGGKTIGEYDKDMNKVRSYQYNKYGKNTEWVLDELSMTKTVYNTKGQASVDINFENREVAHYYYDENSRLVLKTDIYDNKTYFDKKGNMTHTEDKYGKIVMKYNYINDDNGNYVLDTTTELHGNITYYKNGKPQVMKTKDGITEKEWFYDSQTLSFTFERKTNETTWYSIDGKPLYVSYDNKLSKEWLYNEGKLVGVWSETDNSLVVYIYTQEVARLIKLDEKPTAVEVQKLIDSGEIKKVYVDSGSADMVVAEIN
ncbi:MAG: hypothetical protein ABID79_00905 [Elusimicrobiota bacterium]